MKSVLPPWRHNGYGIVVEAHRGGLHPSFGPNTIGAARHALEKGAHVIETDVHFTRDKVAVMAHGWRARGQGHVAARISQLDWSDVQKMLPARAMDVTNVSRLAAGKTSVVAPVSTPYITAFERFLDHIDGPLVVDTKTSDPNDVFEIESVLRQRGRLDNTLFTGMHQLMRDPHIGLSPVVSRSANGWQAAAAFLRSRGVMPDDGLHLGAWTIDADGGEFQSVRVPLSLGGGKLLDVKTVQWANEHGILLTAYPVNTERAMDQCIEAGISGIVTDRVGWATGWLKAEGLYWSPGLRHRQQASPAMTPVAKRTKQPLGLA